MVLHAWCGTDNVFIEKYIMNSMRSNERFLSETDKFGL